MSKLHTFKIRLRYEGGEADKHLLEFYDGSTSFQGFAQALQIVTHAYLNGEVVSRATALKGATFYMRPLQQGSIILELVTVIEEYPAHVTLAAPVFYDFIKYVFSKAVGYTNVEAETPYVSKLSTDDEPFFDDLAEIIEGSLQRGHRPIEENIEKIILARPRSDIITFNQNTAEWVNTRSPDEVATNTTGHVTRFNSITGNGRIYIPSLGKIIPFRQSTDFSTLKKGYLTWSLHGSNLDQDKELSIIGRYIRSSSGEVKRVVIEDCNNISGT